MNIERGGWGLAFGFNNGQRAEIREIIQRYGDAADEFIDRVQDEIPDLLMAWQSYGEIPPEPPAQGIKILEKIAKHAEGLWNALDQLDSHGSDLALSFTLARVRRDLSFMEYLPDELRLLQVGAKAAFHHCGTPEVGRPRDLVIRDFIATLATHYSQVLRRKPAYSRDSMFPRIVAKILSIVLPGNPHSGRANTKIIKSVLTEIR